MKTMVLDLVIPGVGWLRVTATKIGDVIAVEGLNALGSPEREKDIRALIHKCATEAFAKMPERVTRDAVTAPPARVVPKNTRRN